MAGNTVTLVGNLTRDPELRYTGSGQSVATFGLAVNRVWNDRQSNERREAVSYFNIVAWGSLGDNAADSLTKGARIIVTGRLEQRSWETQDGDKRTTVEVIADEIGPSLRWATAQVTRNERRDGGEGGGYGGGGYGGGGGGGGGGRRSSSSSAPPPPPDDYVNEEPF